MDADRGKHRSERVTLQEDESWARSRLMAANGTKSQRFEELAPERQAAILQHCCEKLDIDDRVVIFRRPSRYMLS